MSNQIAGRGMACLNCGRVLTCEDKVEPEAESVACPTCGHIRPIQEVLVA